MSPGCEYQLHYVDVITYPWPSLNANLIYSLFINELPVLISEALMSQTRRQSTWFIDKARDNSSASPLCTPATNTRWKVYQWNDRQSVFRYHGRPREFYQSKAVQIPERPYPTFLLSCIEQYRQIWPACSWQVTIWELIYFCQPCHETQHICGRKDGRSLCLFDWMSSKWWHSNRFHICLLCLIYLKWCSVLESLEGEE